MLIKILIVVISSVLIVGSAYYYFVRSSFGIWFHARISGARVSLFDIAYMRLQKIKPEEIRKVVDLIVNASKGGVKIDIKDLESHMLAGGDVEQIVQALVEAGQAEIPLTAKQASCIELAGRDVLEAIQTTISPTIVNSPEVSSMAMDGVQLKAWCRVTLRANLKLFVGGVGRDTILARVGEGIVSAIGTAKSHKDIISNPSAIPDHIWAIDRDDDNISDIHQDAAYEVISIDVGDVSVGENLRAELDTQRAQADQKKAEALAAMSHAEAVTKREEAVAKEFEMEAKRLEAEIQVPLAIAEAIRSGKLSVRDYFELKNLNADTKMRQAFSALGQAEKKHE